MKLVHASILVSLFALTACGGHVGSDDGSGGGGTPGGAKPGDGTADSGVAPPPADTGTPPVGDTGTPPVEDTAPPVDNGAPSDKYPAFKIDMPQLTTNGGDVLKTPVVVSVTFPSEDPTHVTAYESFADTLGKSDYWKQIVSEYGVGPTVSATAEHVHNAVDLPSMISDTDIDTWVADHATNFAKYGWPAPTDQTIYVIYVPQKTGFTFQGGDVCSSGVGGYHTSTDVGGKQVAYAILPQCDRGGGSIIDETTLSSSHEIGEAATDPHPQSTPGYTGVDDNHLAWEFFMQFQAENGDLCEVYRDSSYKPTSDGDFVSVVQRQWSNVSAAAGHNPCVPVPKGAYFNTVPLGLEDITIDLSSFGSSSKFKTKGYKILKDETKTVSFGFNSDGPTAAWSIKAYEGGAFGPAKTSRLTVTIDKATGQNGEKANVTIKVNSVGKSKSELLTIVSTSGGAKHFMPILIGSQ